MTTTEAEPINVDDLSEATRYYPVKITTSAVYYVWIEAESPKHAVEVAEYDDMSDLLRGEDVADGWADMEAPDEYDAIPTETLGPNRACGECGVVEREPGHLRWANHDGECPRHIHHANLDSVWPQKGTIVGYLTRCSCKAEGFAPPLHPKAEEIPVGMTLYPDRDSGAVVLRQHVEGRPHSRNIPLGIMGDQS